ncbi:unnamed protein product [Gadus morhua 'NCC']
MMRPIRRLRLIGFSTAVERTTCGVSHHVIAFVILCEAEEVEPSGPRLMPPSKQLGVRHGDIITVRHGDIVTGRHGDIVAVRYGDIATGRHGDIVTGRHGDIVTGRHGDIVTGRHGDIITGRATLCTQRLLSSRESKTTFQKSYPPLEPQEDLQTVGHQLHHSVRLGDSSRTQTHRVTLLWSLRKTSRLLATNCTIQSDKGTRFGLRSQVVPLPWMILRTSRPLATNRTTQSD